MKNKDVLTNTFVKRWSTKVRLLTDKMTIIKPFSGRNRQNDDYHTSGTRIKPSLIIDKMTTFLLLPYPIGFIWALTGNYSKELSHG